MKKFLMAAIVLLFITPIYSQNVGRSIRAISRTARTIKHYTEDKQKNYGYNKMEKSAMEPYHMLYLEDSQPLTAAMDSINKEFLLEMATHPDIKVYKKTGRARKVIFAKHFEKERIVELIECNPMVRDNFIDYHIFYIEN
ncbi:hypothetical protein HX109_07495 [Galbibacter sp. BG1]|uniref:hypothetical protein n=1 Tax=Galbibacter sp. BG1 TaxID=1170699 RepID=UPI0015BFC48E|nr:hypothetical protein [Galbibacter sp. BG1]QLE01414.1 hypothetical protein HX109_07495 [Galbibacter sp. BG1]